MYEAGFVLWSHLRLSPTASLSCKHLFPASPTLLLCLPVSPGPGAVTLNHPRHGRRSRSNQSRTAGPALAPDVALGSEGVFYTLLTGQIYLPSPHSKVRGERCICRWGWGCPDGGVLHGLRGHLRSGCLQASHLQNGMSGAAQEAQGPMHDELRPCSRQVPAQMQRGRQNEAGYPMLVYKPRLRQDLAPHLRVTKPW